MFMRLSQGEIMNFWVTLLGFSVCSVFGYGIAIITMADKLIRLEELEEQNAYDNMIRSKNAKASSNS